METRSSGRGRVLLGGSVYSEAVELMSSLSVLTIQSSFAAASELSSPDRAPSNSYHILQGPVLFFFRDSSSRASVACVLTWSRLTKDWTAVL